MRAIITKTYSSLTKSILHACIFGGVAFLPLFFFLMLVGGDGSVLPITRDAWNLILLPNKALDISGDSETNLLLNYELLVVTLQLVLFALYMLVGYPSTSTQGRQIGKGEVLVFATYMGVIVCLSVPIYEGQKGRYYRELANSGVRDFVSKSEEIRGYVGASISIGETRYTQKYGPPYFYIFKIRGTNEIQIGVAAEISNGEIRYSVECVDSRTGDVGYEVIRRCGDTYVRRRKRYWRG